MNITLKNKCCIFLFFLFIFVVSVSSAKLNTDSIQKIIDNSNTPDSTLSSAYYDLCIDVLIINPRKALFYINKSIDHFDRSKVGGFYYKRYIKKAQIFRALGQLDSSLFYSNLYLNHAIKDKLYQYQFNIYGELGNLATAQDNIEKSFDFFNKQIELIKTHNLKESPASVYNNIGIAYGNRGQWDMAFEYFNRALEHDTKNGDPVLLGNDYNNIGVVYLVKKNYDSATVYLERGLKYRRESNDISGISGSLNNLAGIAKRKKDYKKALMLADSALSMAKRYGFKKLEAEVYGTLNDIFVVQGDWHKAHEALTEVFNQKQKAHDDELNNKVEQLESDIKLQEKQSQLLAKDLEIEKTEKQKQKQQALIVISIIALVGLSFFLLSFKKNNKKLKESNEIISGQKNLIEAKHKDITDSINYAKKIQNALIISEENLNKNLKGAFVLFKPRDIVSGDFYWYTKHNGKHVLALADCTGHGVPGAFMSMIGITLLNKIVVEKNIVSPAKILNGLRTDVIRSLNLNDESSSNKDGMDMAIIVFDENELLFAGANSKAIILSQGVITELVPNKQPIGLHIRNEDYTEQRLKITKGMKAYLFTDGIVDQFGGSTDTTVKNVNLSAAQAGGKKLRAKLFRQWIIQTSDSDLAEQKHSIDNLLNNWKKGFEQTDDISLIGIKLG
jgi:serine phosphatase RsbU (regulator of sigma subunit)/Tfp pilus assembly protein PilF